jgi:putative solute:sodium symporter small subunit
MHDARHLRLKAALLLVWALASFGACYFARDLTLMVAGWQLGYWMAAQGAVLVFIAIVVAYCVVMDRFERKDRDG